MARLPTQAAPGSRSKYFWRALGYFALLVGVNTLSYQGIGGTVARLGPEWLAQVVESVAYLVGVIGLTWAFCRFIDGVPLRSLGLRAKGWLSQMSAGWGLGIGLQFLIFVTMAAVGWLTVAPRDWQPPYLVVSIFVYLVISFNEELAFRGYILQRLAQAWGMPVAVLVSTLVFTSVHVLNPNVSVMGMVGIFAAGLLMAYAYLRTGALWLSIGFHIGWNLAEINIFGFAGSGISEPSFVNSVVDGPELMTGGAFGPEGGLLGLAAVAIGFLVLVAGSRLAARRHNTT